LLQRELDRRGYHYRVVNLGVSGDTTQDGLERLPLALAEKPRIVVLEFGANDGLRGQPVSNSQNNLARVIEALQQNGAQVVLAGITLPPNYGPDYIRKFDAVFTALAARYKAPLIPFLLAGVAGHSNLMQSDGLHPNAQGTPGPGGPSRSPCVPSPKRATLVFWHSLLSSWSGGWALVAKAAPPGCSGSRPWARWRSASA
jgi:lysophospholipase L1-like esterase